MITNLVALLITTNLVSCPCQCGFCHGNIRVPEHINRLGYDLKYIVSTNYLPVIQMEIKK